MVPRWRIERELARLKGQVTHLFWLILGEWRKKLYDKRRSNLLKITDGNQKVQDNLFVFLIFQPNGILDSTFAQLRYFSEKGFSPLVVSNTPINDADMAELKEIAFRVIERPNYGYDFGGYRDGVLNMLESGIQPKNLIIMNDSVWFPMPKSNDPVEIALQNPADLYGISYFKHGRKPHLSHIQSYFYRFGERVLADPFFETFWREMPVSSSRYTVIRKCEMGLTYAFSSKGYTVASMFDDDKVIEHVLSLPTAELESLIKFLMMATTRFDADFKGVVQKIDNGEEWREEARSLISEKRVQIPFLLLHPNVLLSRCHSPVLKKDRKEPYLSQRREIARSDLLKANDNPIADEIDKWDSPVS